MVFEVYQKDIENWLKKAAEMFLWMKVLIPDIQWVHYEVRPAARYSG